MVICIASLLPASPSRISGKSTPGWLNASDAVSPSGATRLTTLAPRWRRTDMATLFRWLSTILFVSAIGAMATLLVSDALNALTPTALHRCAGALAFMLIGSSYVALQISLRRPRSEKIKAILLGVAFLFW